jgi:hypothetical protein
MCQNFVLSFGTIQEDESGDLALNDVTGFEDAEGGIGVFPSCEDAVIAWVCRMSHQNIDLVELPRRRGFGLVYSACPRDGGESMLFNVEVHEVGVARTD